ncbi:MAG TPA: hypothetical protein PK719_03665 [Bacteroidales bacterium]|jgi:Tol biopolymer transport system component|nr:tolB protein precursor [Bacteroidales bacterium]OQB60515.1 MAG: translocation protein TolB [Bacteroidetes bacterium ADurb.Bin145]NMD03236.1 tolB protein precursor [Bacteroidales bacterium]HOU03203.1 hypothetical protein [Bacteroidales bacterium]HQG62730.1 hypothetical protein [Bacteroidales bacterium]
MDMNTQYFARSAYRAMFFAFVVLAGLSINFNASAQYFGRNKPGYKTFKYDILQTPHFEIYHYLKNDSLLNTLSQWSEKWYLVHQKVFRDTFKVKNPLIFYNNHADFQQTNTISSMIGTGTGGVTESMKNRVILPVASSLAQTDHTLGHEMVHAFQYHMFLKSDTSEKMSLNNIPLWMIEGMAEYLSIGSYDPHTAMWMRDAVINNDVPTLKKMTTDSKYFPYRYGQAFWSLVGKTWGDTIIVPLLKKTAQYGLSRAADSLIKLKENALSDLWKSSIEVHFRQYIQDKSDSLAGKLLISEKNAGTTNISPSLSPDGKYLAFFSEKNVFTLDLFLADAVTGKVLKRLSSTVRSNEIDDFNFIESAGTWSPDSKKFAFVVFSKGKNKLAIVDVGKSRISKEITLNGVPSFSNPSWSPDGKKIVVTGLVDGINDLYLYYLDSGEVEKLTVDFPSNLHPSWSSDGNYIVFSQEKINSESGRRKYSFNLAILDVKSKQVKELDVFPGAYNLNPLFSADDKSIYFLSDADGFRNLFKYDLVNEKVYRLTEYPTGISGITDFSPAISVSGKDNLIAYTYYFKSNYKILVAPENKFKAREIDRHYMDYDPATLPPLKNVSVNIVDTTLQKRLKFADLPKDSLKIIPFKSKFKLDYISNNANIGVSTGLYGNNQGGSINMIFSDMVGNNQLYSSLSLNGQIYDFSGQVAYLNQKGKIKWGASIGHIPYLSGRMALTWDTISVKDPKNPDEYIDLPVNNLIVDYLRLFEDNISVFASYPLSQTRRFEAGISASWYYYRIDRFNNYYTLDGYNIAYSKEKLPAPSGSNYQQVSMAYVEDNSYFGLTSPMRGHRARFQADKYFGAADVLTALLDYRQYFYMKPFSLAFRFYNYGMYGKNAEGGVLPELYIGYPWLIRGYDNISGGGNYSLERNTFDVSWLSGSRIMVANAELRIPFTGPERYALIKSKWFLTEASLFFDSGLAWNNDSRIMFDFSPVSIMNYKEKYPVFSTGVSMRVNLLGYLVIEPYYAFPLQNGGFKNGSFGINFTPGW